MCGGDGENKTTNTTKLCMLLKLLDKQRNKIKWNGKKHKNKIKIKWSQWNDTFITNWSVEMDQCPAKRINEQKAIYWNV